jgi:predicted acylesterase/phospholipase RssA
MTGFERIVRRVFLLLLTLLLAWQTAAQEREESLRFELITSETAEFERPPKVALVLSGGSALGISHIGLLKVLEELGIEPDFVVGTSMGSLVGGLYAAGYTSAELEETVNTIEWTEIFSLTPDEVPFIGEASHLSITFDQSGIAASAGLLNDYNLDLLLSQLVWKAPVTSGKGKSFALLPTPYYSTGANLGTGDLRIFDSGPLYRAMRASMSLPVAFPPVPIDGEWYVDGGVVDNNPTDIAMAHGADVIIDMDVRKFVPRAPDELTSTTAVTSQWLNLTHRIQEANNPYTGKENYRINMHFQGLGSTDFAKSKTLIKLAEDAVRSPESMAYLRDLAARIRRAREKAGLPAAATKRPESYASVPEPVFESVALISIDTNGQVEAATPDIRTEYLNTLFNDFFGEAADIASLERAIAQLRVDGAYQNIGYHLEDGSDGKTLVLTAQRSREKKNSITLSGNFGASFGKKSAFYLYEALDMSIGEVFYKNSALRAGMNYFLADIHGPGGYIALDFGLPGTVFFETEGSGNYYWPGITGFSDIDPSFNYAILDATARFGFQPVQGLRLFGNYVYAPRWANKEFSGLHSAGFSLALDSSKFSSAPHEVKLSAAVNFPFAGSRTPEIAAPWYGRLDAEVKYLWKPSAARDLALDARFGSWREKGMNAWSIYAEGYDLAGSDGIPAYPLYRHMGPNILLAGLRYREEIKALSRLLHINSYLSLSTQGGVVWMDISDIEQFKQWKGGVRLAMEIGSLSLGTEINFEGAVAFGIYYGGPLHSFR